jgi:hypothetical protein
LGTERTEIFSRRRGEVFIEIVFALQANSCGMLKKNAMLLMQGAVLPFSAVLATISGAWAKCSAIRIGP